jgi:hypothetical protein
VDLHLALQGRIRLRLLQLIRIEQLTNRDLFACWQELIRDLRDHIRGSHGKSAAGNILVTTLDHIRETAERAGDELPLDYLCIAINHHWEHVAVGHAALDGSVDNYIKSLVERIKRNRLRLRFVRRARGSAGTPGAPE